MNWSVQEHLLQAHYWYFLTSQIDFEISSCCEGASGQKVQGYYCKGPALHFRLRYRSQRSEMEGAKAIGGVEISRC